MLRVLHLLSSNLFSGAEQVAKSICLGLRTEFEFAYCSPDGSIKEIIEGFGINYFPLTSMNRGEIAKVVREYNPHIIHAHDYRASVMAASLCTRAKIVSHLHSNYPWARHVNVNTCLFSAALIRFDSVFVVSNSVIDEFVFSSLLGKKAAILGNVVDITQIRLLAGKSKVEKCDLLFVGRLTEPKDPLSFIRLTAALKAEYSEISAIMIGTGEFEDDCRQLVQDLGIEENVRLLGFISNPYPFIDQAQILVVPSKWEGFGLVAMEAMVLGTPVLCSPVGGLVKLVKNGEGGFQCQTFGQFIERATMLLENHHLWEIQSRKGRERGALLADWGGFLDKIRHSYLH